MKITVAFFSLFLSLSSFAGITIVSDLDDTIKITNAGDALEATINGIFTTKTYSGMPQFLSRARDYSGNLTVITGTPNILKENIHRLFRKNDITVEKLYVRKLLHMVNIRDFKLAAIRETMNASTDDFIFLGDNVDQDHNIYDSIKKEFGDRVLAIYIHVVKSKELPESSTPYYTSADLVLREVLAGRMNESAITEVVSVLENEKKTKHIFPDFAQCPSEATVWEWQSQSIYSPLYVNLTQKLLTYCSSRQ